LFKNGNRQLRLVEFTDEFVEPDWCEKGHIGMLLDGILEISFNGNVVRYKAGNGIFIPSGKTSAHKGRSITPVSRMILVEELL
jgi:ethanolamine utilization protein EutQ (cupin superfamily)